MQYSVSIHTDSGIKTVTADRGSNLLTFLEKNGVEIKSDCGGNGTCGKCCVKVSGLRDVIGEEERRVLSREKTDKGYRLSCMTEINSDIDVYIQKKYYEDPSIITEINDVMKDDYTLKPIVRKKYCEMDMPSLENQTSDLDRILSAINKDGSVGLHVLKQLPDTLRKSSYKVTAVICGEKLIAVEPGDTTEQLYGAAFDIGTTTAAAYLYNLNNGKCAAISSMLNPQRKYGADVLSRIAYSIRSDNNKSEIQREIIQCINELLGSLADMAGISREDIYASVFAGNTTMLHFLLGIDASGIGAAPFIPVTTRQQFSTAEQLKLNMNNQGTAVVFPSVSAYVGGDTLAAISATGIAESEDISLLVDIGTNGEIVLGCSKWLLSCSTAAGPAFEGANISNGIGGVKGAIDSVGEGPDFKYTTIGNAEPVGICGSGVVQAISRLLDAGIIDETGRIAESAEAVIEGDKYGDRIIEADGVRAFVLRPSNITITQRDIRELQNAKAAIAAGIQVLIMRSGKKAEDIKKVYLAGGFGSRIDIKSALNVGLLPKAFEGKIEAVGNAAGAGSCMAILTEGVLEGLEDLSRRIKYIELSSSQEFSDRYIENMIF